MRVPNSGCSAAAMSPTAKMSGSLVRSDESTSTPPSPDRQSRPVRRARCSAPRRPRPGRRRRRRSAPSPSRSPVASPPAVVISSTVAPSRRSTPCSRCSSANTSPTSRPSAASSGTSAISTTVTLTPRSRAPAATSRPIQPPPTIASEDALRQHGIQGVGVVDGAQVVHSVGVGSRDRWPARRANRWRAAACRSARCCRPAASRCGPCGSTADTVGAELQLDVVVAIPGRRGRR